MSGSSTALQSDYGRTILFTDEGIDDGVISAQPRRHEKAFRNVLSRIGFEQSFPMKSDAHHECANSAVDVLVDKANFRVLFPLGWASA